MRFLLLFEREPILFLLLRIPPSSCPSSTKVAYSHSHSLRPGHAHIRSHSDSLAPKLTHTLIQRHPISFAIKLIHTQKRSHSLSAHSDPPFTLGPRHNRSNLHSFTARANWCPNAHRDIDCVTDHP
eukprot:6205480-Pyramimonas_sp.AAC.1